MFPLQAAACFWPVFACFLPDFHLVFASFRLFFCLFLPVFCVFFACLSPVFFPVFHLMFACFLPIFACFSLVFCLIFACFSPLPSCCQHSLPLPHILLLHSRTRCFSQKILQDLVEQFLGKPDQQALPGASQSICHPDVWIVLVNLLMNLVYRSGFSSVRLTERSSFL